MSKTRDDTVLFEEDGMRILHCRCRKRGAATYRPALREIALPRKGLFLRETRRTSTVADLNHVLFFGPDDTSLITHPLSSDDESTVIHLDERFFDELGFASDSVGEWDSPFVSGACLTSATTCVLHSRLQALVRGSGSAMEIHETAIELLVSLFRDALGDGYGRTPEPKRSSTKRRHRDKAVALKILLGEQCGRSWTLPEVAEKFETSPFHLNRVFRRETGLAVHQYLRRTRLRSAAQRLCDGEADISRLASDLGFSDHSHLTNAFRSEFGLSPRAFRGGDVGSRIYPRFRNPSVRV